MIRLMSDCLLRVSEVVTVNVRHFKQNTLIVQKSKTDQQGEGTALYVTSDTRNAISKYRENAGIGRGALFRHIRRGGHIQRSRLTDVSARMIIKKRTADASVKGFISAYSLRVGSAVSLAKAGTSVVDLHVAVWWKNSHQHGKLFVYIKTLRFYVHACPSLYGSVFRNLLHSRIFLS